MRITAYASGSGGNLYKVSALGSSLLIEAGLPMKQIRKALNYDLSDIDGCLVSHAHQDHARSVPALLEHGVKVLMHPDAAEQLDCGDRLYLTSGDAWRLGKWWSIKSFDVKHDSPGACGFLVNAPDDDRLLYVSDAAYVRYRFGGLTHVMIECNYARDILDDNVRAGRISHDLRNRIRRSHMSLGTVKDMLRANDLSRLQEVWLMHLSDANSDEERFKREVQKIVGVPVHVASRMAVP